MSNSRIKIRENVALDSQTNELIFSQELNDQKIRIEPNMSRLISIMAHSSGSMVSREELIDLVWDGHKEVGDKALTKNIYKVRKVFGENGVKNLIETIPKKGYRLKSEKQNRKKRFSKNATIALIGTVVGFVCLKLMVPGLFHMLFHRMPH